MECFFDRYAKEPNQYEIEKVALIRATNRLRIEIAADTIVPYTEITTIKEDLKDLLPDVSGVDLFFDYRQINSPSEGDILAYLPYLVGEIAKEDAFYAHSISTTDVKVKENTIVAVSIILERMMGTTSVFFSSKSLKMKFFFSIFKVGIILRLFV